MSLSSCSSSSLVLVGVFGIFFSTATRAADLTNRIDHVDPPERIRFAPPATNIIFVPTNTPLIPTAWTGSTVSPDFGHNPFNRAPDLMKPRLTNASVEPTLRPKVP